MKITRQETTKNIFPYIAYVPNGVTEHPALIIHLHGAGERGDGGKELDKVLVHGLPKIANDENLKDAVLIMPQCPTGSFWAAKVESIRKFIDEMVRKFSADNTQIYLCGLSMGGFGTWYTAMAYPDLFAAIAPCCGGGMAWNAGVLKMPIWTFHGLEDSVVSPHQTVEMIEKLKSINPNLKYDLYEGVNHNSWDLAFTEKLLDWFFTHKKAE